MKVASAETRVMMMLYIRAQAKLRSDWEPRLGKIRDVATSIYTSEFD
jgi:hypothetical protein